MYCCDYIDESSEVVRNSLRNLTRSRRDKLRNASMHLILQCTYTYIFLHIYIHKIPIYIWTDNFMYIYNTLSYINILYIINSYAHSRVH